MHRALPLLALVVVIAGGVFYLMDGSAPHTLDEYDDDAGLTDDERERVLLEGDPQAAARAQADAEARDQAKAEKLARERALAMAQPKTFLEGRVVDASTGEPIEGAYAWLETASQPCPRLPRRGAWRQSSSAAHGSFALTTPLGPQAGNQAGGAGMPPPRTPQATERTDADGRFSMAARGDIDHSKLQGGFDLFVLADSYVAAVVCALPNGRPVAVRLERGHRVRGTVRNVFNRPVKDALVRAVPAGDTPKQLGHYAWTTTDEQGRFELTGLIPGSVNVRVQHNSYMPKQVGPIDPAAGQSLDIQLISALFVSFAIETTDRQPPKNPTVEWRTSGKPPRTGLQIVGLQRDGKGGGRLSKDGAHLTVPVPIPCDHREVLFTVKADAYSAWRSESVLLPQEGGEKVIPVALLPDTSQGRIRIRFENESGEALTYSKIRGGEGIRVRGNQPVEGGVVKHIADDFALSGVPPGPYALIFNMPAYAPSSVEFEARAGEETTETVTLRAAARLRVRFVASEPMVVGFRVLKDRVLAPTWPEGAPRVDPDADPNAASAPRVQASDNGTVFTGFGSGVHVVEVTDPKLRATPTRVTLIEGDEVEVEIRVSRR